MAEILQARKAATIFHGSGRYTQVRVGQLAHADHPIVEKAPHLWGPLRIHFATTAAEAEAASEPEQARPRRTRKPAPEE